MEKEIEEKINKLSMMEQNSQYLSQQRQSFQNQLLEIESAIDEMDEAEESYKIIGSVMVKVDKEKLKKDLDEKKKVIDIRVQSIKKQEDKVKESSEELRAEVMKGLEKEQ